MQDLVDSIRELVAQERRANRIDAEWEVRAREVAFRQRAKGLPAGLLIAALAEVLHESDADDARYMCWLLLDAVPDGELPHMSGALASMADVDARVVAALALVGRARSVPAWLAEILRSVLAEAAARASRNQEAVVAILRRAAENPAHFEVGEALRHGGRLFNAGKFYEAHEAWEDVWRPMKGAERDFFRGLIQLAVALKKAREGNPAGTIRLVERADTLLAPYEPAHRGVDVTALRRSMAKIRREADAWAAGSASGLTTSPPRLPG